ncbi:MAG: redoxin domain-containing protein [Chloroflexi bacterium]|nr:redoxin domain-containing protein [Chloroflexota bacterium]
MALEVGTPAPDFNKRTNTGERVALSQFKGQKNVLLAFFTAAFTGG